MTNIHERVPKVTTHQRTSNKTTIRDPLTAVEMTIIKKQEATSVSKGVEKLGSSLTAGGNATGPQREQSGRGAMWHEETLKSG